MKFILVLAAFASVALATPSSGTDRNILDVIQNVIDKLNRPPISAGPAIVEGSPISVGPALVEDENLISVGPALVEEESPISVGPALVEEESPISVGPALVEEESPIPVGPVIVNENPAVDELPDVISTLPIYPDDENAPITIDLPGLPSINIVINVNSPAPQEFDEIEPTPILVVDDFEVGPVPVQVGDHIEPTPVIVVDNIDEVPASYDEDFVADPSLYY